MDGKSLTKELGGAWQMPLDALPVSKCFGATILFGKSLVFTKN